MTTAEAIYQVGILGVLILLALGLSITSLVLKKMLLSTLAAFAWLLCAMFAYLQTSLEATIPLLIFFVLCFLTMLMMTYRLSAVPQEPVVPYNHTTHLRETLERYKESRRRL